MFKTEYKELLDRPLRDFITRSDLANRHGLSEAAISVWDDPLLERMVTVGKRLYLYLEEDVSRIKRKPKGRKNKKVVL